MTWHPDATLALRIDATTPRQVAWPEGGKRSLSVLVTDDLRIDLTHRGQRRTYRVMLTHDGPLLAVDNLEAVE